MRVLRYRAARLRALPGPQRHRASSYQGPNAQDQRLRRALQRHRARRVLPRQDAGEPLRERRSAPGRPRCLAASLQHRTPPSRVSKPETEAHRNHQPVREPRRLSGHISRLGLSRDNLLRYHTQKVKWTSKKWCLEKTRTVHPACRRHFWLPVLRDGLMPARQFRLVITFRLSYTKLSHSASQTSRMMCFVPSRLSVSSHALRSSGDASASDPY